jgi:hypothetical protein
MKYQDHVWYEIVVPYGVARSSFCNYSQWKYVKPFDPNFDTWIDSEMDMETEDDQKNDKVRIKFRESTVTNELSVYCNKVLMTPSGLELPDGELSIIAQQAGYLDPHFFYGRSFMDNMRGWVAVKDVLMSTGVDISRQILEPPLKSRFRTMINRYMLAPRAVTPMQGDGDLTPILPAGQAYNFVMEMMKGIGDQIDKLSISPTFQGQQQAGDAQKTKFQIQQELIQSIRNAASMVGAAAQWRKQEAEKKLKIGIKRLAEMTGTKIEVSGSSGNIGKVINFDEAVSDPKQYGKLVREMAKAENLFRLKGERKKIYMASKDKMGDYSWVFDFRANPQSRDSDVLDQKDAIDKANLLASRPGIDQKAVDKMIVRALNEDENEFIPKNPPMQPGQPMQAGQPQMPGQPGQPPTQGAQPPLPQKPMLPQAQLEPQR